MRREADDVLLAEQLRLLQEKKVEARELLDRGRGADEILAHEIANDLAGIRFVIRAAVNKCGPGPRRDELERLELEVRELLREVVRPRPERHRPGRSGDLLAGDLVAAS